MQFSAVDIFVNPDGKQDFKINNNQIELIDWQRIAYISNSEGKDIL